MNIILVGIQGSGKGTQARKITEMFSYNFFEMGQKLRNFADLDLPESQEVREYLKEGKLVSIEMIGRILVHYKQTHKDGFVLFDGIPRTIEQKDMFDSVIKDYIVIFLDLKKDEAIRRLSLRRIDPITGESFGPEFKGEINPETGNKLIFRSDDTPEAVSRRVETFYQNTLPLLALWASEGRKVYTIDAGKGIDEVFEEIQYIIQNKIYSSI
ncbi:MAG: nucleoside monophosphate kinase [Candidatus Gracilibacteria bacterium]|nr:nucleoside monophosphate kinase [Candidatus Gracilibacteria bacterium]